MELIKEEKQEFIKFIKEQFGESYTYDQNGYPLYFDDKGNMKNYDLEEGYKIFKEII